MGPDSQPAALRRGTAKNKVHGHETRRRLVDLHVYQGKRLGECAREMGLSYGRTLAQWHRVLADVRDGVVPEEQLRDVRTHCDQMLRQVITTSMPLVGNSAAHGMVTLKALEGLCRLYGVVGPEAAAVGPGPATLAEIGASVRLLSPLLADKLDRLKTLRCRVAGDIP